MGIYNQQIDNLEIYNFSFYNLTYAIFLGVYKNYTIRDNKFYYVGTGIHLDMASGNILNVSIFRNYFS